MTPLLVLLVSWIGLSFIGLALWAGACEWAIRRKLRHGGVADSGVTSSAPSSGELVPPRDWLERDISGRRRRPRCLECGEDFEPIVYAGEEELVCLDCVLDQIIEAGRNGRNGVGQAWRRAES